MCNKFINGFLILFTAGIFLFNGCKSDDPVSPGPVVTPDAVYTQTNESGGNNIIMFSRSTDGNINLFSSFSTQGLGNGMGLGSQGALAFNDDRTYLFAVNAGSNDISVFAVSSSGLTFKNRTSSGGTTPVSVAVKGDLLYVLNAGGSGNISGFRIGAEGSLTAIAGSTKNLSNNGVGMAPGPAQVSFNPSRTLLVVTEKMSNKIITYTVNTDGTVTGPNIFSSVGITPFGFEFRNDEQIVVSEAFMGGIDSSAVSSYSVTAGGMISVISGPVFTTETAACWIVITGNGAYTYTSNTGSGTITGYSLNASGVLTILNAGGVTADIGAGTGPIDMALSSDSQFLYSLNSGNQTISSLRVNSSGSLTAINLSSITGLPVSAAGLICK